MSDYQRTTRICTLDDLPVPLAQALWQRALDQGIKDLAQEALIVCETTSTKIKRSGSSGFVVFLPRALCQRQ